MAASNGFRKPKAAIPSPTLSTAKVPAKFCMMMPAAALRNAQRFNELGKIISYQDDI